MRNQQSLWKVLALSLFLMVVMSCVTLPPRKQTPSATPTSAGAGNSGGEIANTPNPTSNPTSIPTMAPTSYPTPVPTIAPTSNPTPSPQGPYVVKQIRSAGGETISGEVCSITEVFDETFKAPAVTFITKFVPQNASAGNLSYAYSLPKAGETHDATGTYTLSLAGADGTLLLSMKVSDHVVFKGFDGIMPVNYEFNLVPSMNTSCPASH
jgi:hypothetical protein